MPEYLYIHIPFCIRKCIYCDFLSITYDEPYAKKYVAALCKELSLKKDSAGALKTIYIGGGTPTVLPDECFGINIGTLPVLLFLLLGTTSFLWKNIPLKNLLKSLYYYLFVLYDEGNPLYIVWRFLAWLLG